MSAGHGDPPAPVSSDAVATAARAGEPDRYLAALLAPPPARSALLALAAFAAEIARVPSLVTREPAMGEIRMQWWRDALQLDASTRTGNPVADAVREACTQHELSIEPLLGLIDAQSHNLYADPVPDEPALERYCAMTDGALFAHAGRILRTAADARLETASAASGQAYGVARLLFTLPQALSRGRVPLPATRLEEAGLTAQEVLAGAGGAKLAQVITGLQRDARACLAAARQHVANLPREMRVAFLPLALVESYLRALGRSGSAPRHQAPRVAPLVRIARIAAAHWLRGP